MSGAAHSLQNFAPGLLFAPHRGHFATIGEAHSLQNFALSGFSAEQFWQRIDLPADQGDSNSIYHLTWGETTLPTHPQELDEVNVSPDLADELMKKLGTKPGQLWICTARSAVIPQLRLLSGVYSKAHLRSAS